jgi:phosphopantothenoylcysteine decarboxylase/phosphopantothenate--cysteine ligase
MSSATPSHPKANAGDAHGTAVDGAGLAGRHIALCVSGSIAAYKACELARLLVKQGAQVHVLMTRSAQEFIGAATLAGITGHPVSLELFEGSAVGESHVTLSAQSDLLVIAPATADLLARLATGRADDVVTATALCARCPILVAPAMHPSMWEHPATQRNVEQIRSDGRVTFVGPVRGQVASGDVGLGRFAEPEHILHQIIAALTPQDLKNRHVVVSAGPTFEDMDPVRFLANRSTGKMGFALANCAAQRGARVTLVAGPTTLQTPPNVVRIDVRSALEMRAALREALGSDLQRADILIMAAAVSDFRFSDIQREKLKRDKVGPALQLENNPDILAEFGAQRRQPLPLLIGFAVETRPDTMLESARHKLNLKRVDLVVANLAKDSFGSDENCVTLVEKQRELSLPACSKQAVAAQILNWANAALGALH